ncbi:MAG: hypothetical protein LUD29_03715 [Clostridia bacterium]|nr:hypothetical protein [Clostridia bacterium]
MKRLDIRFDRETMDLLRSLIGKKMNKFMCQRRMYSAAVDEVVIFQIENVLYKLTNAYQDLEYMNHLDDVGVFKFGPASEDDIKWYEALYTPKLDMISTPIEQNIMEIRILHENQQLYHFGEQVNDVNIVRGVIFVMEDGLEIALEKDMWFSEFIYVTTGHNLMDEFRGIDETHLQTWKSDPEYEAKGSRELVVLK